MSERHHGKKGVCNGREARSRLRKGQKSVARTMAWPISASRPRVARFTTGPTGCLCAKISTSGQIIETPNYAAHRRAILERPSDTRAVFKKVSWFERDFIVAQIFGFPIMSW